VTPDQRVLVQDSFELVKPIASAAIELFYARLFELDPSLRPMFPADMLEQRRKLIQTLGFAVAGLDRPATIMPAVRALGRRHAGYGVQPEHFETVGAALLWTLAEGLGPAFSPEVRDAWAAVYTALADEMRLGLAEASLPAAA
jgi:hemoglobin-like flavoprotein